MYAVVNADQVVIDVIETGPVTAPEGGFIAQTDMYNKGDYYGVGGFPTFSELDGETPVVEAPVEAPVVPATDPTEESNG